MAPAKMIGAGDRSMLFSGSMNMTYRLLTQMTILANNIENEPLMMNWIVINPFIVSVIVSAASIEVSVNQFLGYYFSIVMLCSK